MNRPLESGLIHAMRAFVKVIDSGSFTAAAEQMELTTAQVSRLVGDLERRLGTKLLQRTTRNRALTDAGAEFADRCRDILSLLQEAEANAAGTLVKPTGRLRIQCMASFGQHYVAPYLSNFCSKYPELTVNYSTSQYFPDLLARGVDVSLYLAETLNDSGLAMKRLGTSFAVLCASPGYLAANAVLTNPDDLQDHPCLRLSNPSITPEWRLTSPGTSIRTLVPKGPLVADTPEIVRDMALQGAGVALLPLFSVIDAIKAGRLERVLSGWRSPDIGVYALLPSRQFIDGKTRAWLEWVDQTIAPSLRLDAAYFGVEETARTV